MKKGYKKDLNTNHMASSKYIDQVRTIVDVLEVPGFITDHESRIMHANPRALDQYGYSLTELLDESIEILSDETSPWENNLERISKGSSCETHQVDKAKDGSSISIRRKVTRLAFADDSASDTPLFMDLRYNRKETYAVNEDKEKIEEYRKIISAITENALDGIVIMNHLGLVIFFNKAAERITGYAAEEIMNKPVHDILAPERYQKKFNKNFSIFQKTGQGNAIGTVLELVLKRKDGIEVPIELSLAPIERQGKFDAIGIMKDISERTALKKALLASEEMYKAIFENTGAGCCILNKDGLILKCNSKFAEYAGMKVADIENKKLWMDYVQGDELKRMLTNQAAREAGADVPLHYKFKFTDIRGNTKDTLLTMGFVGKEKYRVTSLFDITELESSKRKEQELRERLNQAEKMEALGLLASGVAHDLNNILSGVVSYPDLLLMNLPDDSPLKKPIETIKSSGERAAAIVQDLLVLGRRGVQNHKVIDMNEIIREYMSSPEFLKLSKQNPTVDIQYELENSTLKLYGSHSHLSKTVMNLVTNAIEAIPKYGSVSIKTSKAHILSHSNGSVEIPEDNYVIVEVSDTGIGIPKESISRIFEPFYSNKKMGHSGTGLGMSIVWGAVQDHSGYIDVNSHTGEGTTFRIYFPETADEIDCKDESTAMYDKGSGQSILVVDDIKQQRDIATDILLQLGYEVDAVSSGEEVISYLKSRPVDLLILDMIMGDGMDGLDTYMCIQKENPGQKVIIASGFSETGRTRRAMKLGAAEYIQKPYGITQLNAVVKKCLESDKS